MRHSRGLGGVALLCLLSAAGLTARQAQTPPTFRSGTDLVTVDALVTDSHGNAVTGLTAADFQIVEKGRPQRVSTLTYVTLPLVERKEIDPVPVGPIRDVVTNRLAPHSRAYAVVVDDLHLVTFHAARVERVLTDLLGSIPATDRVAIVFVGRSDLSIDLTDDRAAQMQAVSRVKESLGSALDLRPVACGAKETERMHDALASLEVLRNVAETLAQTHADETSAIYLSEGLNYDFSATPNGDPKAMKALADSAGRACDENGLRPVSPSKSTWPGDPQENPVDADLIKRTLKETLDDATRANVRVYTIDPRGNLPVDAEITGWMPGNAARTYQSKATMQHDFLRQVAAETGALAAVERSDLHGAVRQVMQDTGSYYLLGYTPDPLARDGLYHPISVKVLRPGLTLRARQGYLAPAATAPVTTGTAAITAGLVGADAARGLALAGFVAPILADGHATKAAVTIEVTYPGPAKVPASVVDDLQCDVLTADAEGSGRLLSTKAFHFAVTPTRPGDLVFLINAVVDISPGLANLRIGVASKATGKVGTVSIPARIPDLTEGVLQMPTLVLGRPAVREPALPADALTGVLPFQPTLTRRFLAADVLQIYAPVSWGASVESVGVTAAITGGGATLTKAMTVKAGAPVAGLRHAAVDLAVALASLKPGDHVLTVTAVLPGGTPVSRRVGFAIVDR